MKKFELELPFLSEIVYKKKTKNHSGLAYNKDKFTIEFEDEKQSKEFEYLWYANVHNMLYKKNQLKGDTNVIFAERVFYVLYPEYNRIIPDKNTSKFYSDKVNDLTEMSRKISMIVSQRFENTFVNDEDLKNVEIVRDYNNREKEVIQQYLNDFVKNGYSLMNNQRTEKNMWFKQKILPFFHRNNFVSQHINYTPGKCSYILLFLSNSHLLLNNVVSNIKTSDEQKIKSCIEKINENFRQELHDFIYDLLDDTSFIIREKSMFGNSDYEKKILDIMLFKMSGQNYENFLNLLNKHVLITKQEFEKVFKDVIVGEKKKIISDYFAVDFPKEENTHDNNHGKKI